MAAANADAAARCPREIDNSNRAPLKCHPKRVVENFANNPKDWRRPWLRSLARI